MRWSIIRLIWLRELRDQLRDRRTMFVMVVLPLLIYPLGGVALMQITLGSVPGPSVIGVSDRTVAVRSPPSSTAISPKWSPGTSRPMNRPLDVTFACPFKTT